MFVVLVENLRNVFKTFPILYIMYILYRSITRINITRKGSLLSVSAILKTRYIISLEVDTGSFSYYFIAIICRLLVLTKVHVWNLLTLQNFTAKGEAIYISWAWYLKFVARFSCLIFILGLWANFCECMIVSMRVKVYTRANMYM